MTLADEDVRVAGAEKARPGLHLPRKAALLVIDMQAGFDDPSWGRRNNPGAEDCVVRLLAAWRASGRPIIHVHHTSLGADGCFRAGTPGQVAKSETGPRIGEAVVGKTVNSGFIGTGMEAMLRGDGIETVVLVGLTTNHCVSTTARMAGNLGFRTLVVSDATAAFDRRALDGSMRPAQEVHLAALSDLKDEFAEIVDTAAVLRALGA
ncbi:MAG: cysteine hydrolase [Proteobacteria bacterium]|nr:cysteine hydrolase [Pseudomonadota bacterium]